MKTFLIQTLDSSKTKAKWTDIKTMLAEDIFHGGTNSPCHIACGYLNKMGKGGQVRILDDKKAVWFAYRPRLVVG